MELSLFLLGGLGSEVSRRDAEQMEKLTQNKQVVQTSPSFSRVSDPPR